MCGGGSGGGGGGGGGFHSIMWSPQLRFVLELGCDNKDSYVLRVKVLEMSNLLHVATY